MLQPTQDLQPKTKQLMIKKMKRNPMNLLSSRAVAPAKLIQISRTYIMIIRLFSLRLSSYVNLKAASCLLAIARKRTISSSPLLKEKPSGLV